MRDFLFQKVFLPPHFSATYLSHAVKREEEKEEHKNANHCGKTE